MNDPGSWIVAGAIILAGMVVGRAVEIGAANIRDAINRLRATVEAAEGMKELRWAVESIGQDIEALRRHIRGEPEPPTLTELAEQFEAMASDHEQDPPST